MNSLITAAPLLLSCGHMSRQILLGALLLSFHKPESFLKAKERTKVVVAFFFLLLPIGVVDV
jgi:hypothetical protein